MTTTSIERKLPCIGKKRRELLPMRKQIYPSISQHRTQDLRTGRRALWRWTTRPMWNWSINTLHDWKNIVLAARAEKSLAISLIYWTLENVLWGTRGKAWDESQKPCFVPVNKNASGYLVARMPTSHSETINRAVTDRHAHTHTDYNSCPRVSKKIMEWTIGNFSFGEEWSILLHFNI